MITAIFSGLNEAENEIFWRNLALLRGRAHIIVVDGGSRDQTLARLLGLGLDVYLEPGSNRARRYNLGLRQAQGTLLLLVHPRSLLSPEAIAALERRDREGVEGWGALTHSFDEEHWLLRFTSWYSNQVRGGARGIYYLDHCLFLTRGLQAEAVFPDVDIFEDTLFCTRLRRVSWPVRLPQKVVTSAIRFRRTGIWRQSLMNQVLKVLFHLGASKEWMNRVYEKGLGLNRQS